MAAVADSLGLADWGLVAAKYATFRDRSSSRYWFQRAFITTVHTNQPISRVRCEFHFDSEPGIAKDLSFPDHWGGSVLFPGSRNSTFFADANGVMGVESTFSRIHWLELPPTLFQNSTMRAIVGLPTAAGSSSLTYLTCNIDSRWANSTMFPCGSGVYCGAPVGYDRFVLGHTLLNWTWIAIRSDVVWASALNPSVQRSGYNTSTVAAVAHAAGVTSALDDSYPAVLEAILAVTFTDGLARLGNKASLQGSLKEAGNNFGNEMPTDGLWVDEWMRYGNAYQIDEQKSQAERWAQLRMETRVNGYAYSFDSITTKIAITVLMLHASLAVCHSFYEMTSGLSSSSWDSVAELLALAMNSSPTKTLQNTCAGISQLATMKLLVLVVATKVDHLELDFTSPSEEYELLSKDDVGKLVTAPCTVYPNSTLANAGTFEPNRLYGNVTTGASLETDAGAVRLRKSSSL